MIIIFLLSNYTYARYNYNIILIECQSFFDDFVLKNRRICVRMEVKREEYKYADNGDRLW